MELTSDTLVEPAARHHDVRYRGPNSAKARDKFKREERDINHREGDDYAAYYGPPPCWGMCFAGSCQLDRTESGCCRPITQEGYVQGGDVAGGNLEIGEGEVPGQLSSHSHDNVYCWKATHKYRV